MKINSLFLENLRCFKEINIKFSNGVNFLVGFNGSGKTTILESIQVLGTGKSFRTSKIENMRNYEANSFTIASEIERRGVLKTIGFHKEALKFKIRIDSLSVNRLSELVRNFSIVTYHSNSILMIEGESQHRRRFIDWWLFHSNNEFYSEWLRYQRLLKQRNAALKNDIKSINIWDSVLSESGEKINFFRSSAVSMLMSEVFFLIDLNYSSFPKFSWHYVSGWNKNESLMSSLKRNQQKDIQYGFTSVGPHRADLRFIFNGKDAKDSLSRGQQKTLSLIFLITLASIHKKYLHETPIFMLDDIAAELDTFQRNNSIEQIIDLGGQVLLTALDLNDLKFRPSTCLNTFVLQEGEVHML